MNGLSEKELVWPPTREDLRRLYVDERLSAMKIAQRYGLKYASPKTAESTILYHLKRAGISRRDRAEHVRKVTEQMVDDWVRRYQEGESLKQIAGGSIDPVTVFYHLRRRGLRLRDKVDAQIKAVTKHEKKPFPGNLVEKAYLLGLGWGDLHVSRHGRAVRVKTATTHPAMVELLRRCFERYGTVNIAPRKSTLTGYEWSVQVDLDATFEFLLDKYGQLPRWVARENDTFQSFLAGFFDAEGSIYLNKAREEFEVSISNEDSILLQVIFEMMSALGYDSRLVKIKNSNLWRIYMWKPEQVRKFLTNVAIRHGEKSAKASLALSIQAESDPSQLNQLLEMWDRLRVDIKHNRDRLVDDARSELAVRGSANGN